MPHSAKTYRGADCPKKTPIAAIVFSSVFRRSFVTNVAFVLILFRTIES